MKAILATLATIIGSVILGYFFLSRADIPPTREYGVTFSPAYAREIGIDWRAAYRATLDELGVRKFRLVAYWDQIERERDAYDWSELDELIREAGARDARVILAIGRRVPRWPECHIPQWARELPWEEQKSQLRDIVRATVERYKDNPTITMWQVENEVFLPVFADESCGDMVDEAFFEEELALVRSLDSRPIMVTDSGNLGLWYKPYQLADVFGTSLYIYFYRPDTGMFRTALPSSLYAVKGTVMRLLYGQKPVILSELSLEPWLAAPIEDVPLLEQRSRMSVPMMEEIIAYAAETPFREQYLWGVEWWYYMREKGHPDHWLFAKVLFAD